MDHEFVPRGIVRIGAGGEHAGNSGEWIVIDRSQEGAQLGDYAPVLQPLDVLPPFLQAILALRLRLRLVRIRLVSEHRPTYRELLG